MKPTLRNSAHFALVAIASFGVLLYGLITSGQMNNPPLKGDGVDYDAIGFSLSNGNGFAYDWDNPVYLAPYEPQKDSVYAYLFARTGAFPTANRPPLYPYILASIYLVFGRSFAIARLLNVLVMACTGVIVFDLARRLANVWIGYLCAGFLLFSAQISYYVANVLTECLACLMTALMAWFLVLLAGRDQKRYAYAAGAMLGLSVLNRSIFLLWIPILLALVFLLKFQAGWKKAAAASGAVLAAALLVLAPWMIRNCILLGNFMPFGTQGQINLPAAYSDSAYAQLGVWQKPADQGVYQDIEANFSGLDREIAEAQYGQATGLAWIRKNWRLVPQLAFWKVIDLWRPESALQSGQFILAGLGLLFLPRRTALIFGGMVLANTLAVSLTWSVGNRFMVPVLPLIYLSAGLALYGMGRAIYLRFFTGKSSKSAAQNPDEKAG